MFGTSTAPHRPAFLKALALVPAAALLVLAGCGDDGLGTRYPVSGTVSYKGAPLESGTISFYPAGGEDSRGAFGTIENGSYTLSTQGGDDGAFPGDYKISITARNVDMSTAEKNAGGGSARQDDVAKAYKGAQSLIPRKYESPDNSGLTAKVEAKSNTFNFELTD